RVARAIENARARVADSRGDVLAWRELGAILDAHRFTPAAESAYREAVRIDDDDPWTCYQLAIVLEMMDKEPEESLRLFDLVARARPELPQPIIHSGRVLDASGDSEGARDAYLRALKIDERQPLVHRALGQVYLDLGESALATRHLERAAELSPRNDGPTWAALAQAYERSGETERATRAREVAAQSGNTLTLIDPLRAMVTTIGVSSKIALERGTQRMSMGDFRGATADFLIAAEVRELDPWIQLRLATCYQETSSKVAASKHFARAQELRGSLAEDPQDQAALDAACARYTRKYLGGPR
ncbi:MAG: tetratricopeptide repeat protein, partial [Planctomycetes bacterium]|nr:tetratricopeptide repeat protein [Planctomycetota bacterium]